MHKTHPAGLTRQILNYDRCAQKEKVNAQTLCLLQCAVESAPQLILQLFILFKDPTIGEDSGGLLGNAMTI